MHTHRARVRVKREDEKTVPTGNAEEPVRKLAFHY